VTVALEVEDVSKVFRLFRERPSSLKQRVLSGRMRAEDFWALRDIAFEVQEGSSLGLIGHNGSGKTTLLKCIAGILRPTSGVIRYRGRIAALLELGAGFHPELTGRENIFLNGAILGMRRAEIRAKFDEIVAFAELDRFIDTPVKRYSATRRFRMTSSGDTRCEHKAGRCRSHAGNRSSLNSRSIVPANMRRRVRGSSYTASSTSPSWAEAARFRESPVRAAVQVGM
jgi:ABC-type polysaccharide/polyol phosphate transport system ATPase subunit